MSTIRREGHTLLQREISPQKRSELADRFKCHMQWSSALSLILANLSIFDMSHEEKNITVLIEDTDAFGRLNWRVFCRYCELGEAGLLNSLGFDQMYFYEKYGISFPRRFASFEYLSQVFPTDLIDFKTKVKRVGNTSLTLSHTFYKRSKKLKEPVLVARAEVVIVAYDEKNRRKTPLPENLVEKIREICPEAFEA